jgi:XPB/Ssl2-like helicase family protein
MTTGHRDVGRLIAAYSRRAAETWAQARGLDPQKLRGPVLQKELARLLLASSALKAALAETTDEEQTALARIKLAGGKLPAQELKAQLAIDEVKEPDAAITSLMARGLLYYERSFEGYYGAWELWGSAQTSRMPLPPLWLPSEVNELVTVPDDLGRLPLEPAPPPSRIREGSFTTLQRDLYLLLQALRENPVKLLKSGGVSKRDSERLLKILPATGGAADDPTAGARTQGAWFHFLWFLIQAAELLHEEPGRMSVSPARLQFLSLDETQQALVLLRAWPKLLEWNEFLRIPTIQTEHDIYGDLGVDALSFGGFGFGDLPSPPQIAGARLMLMELFLREHPYPGWHSFTSLMASMQRFQVNFLIPRSDVQMLMPWGMRGGKEDRRYRGFFARDSKPRRYFDKDKDWNLVEGAFLRNLLEEPLLWLGIVRLGYQGDELVAFEVTERGAVAIGLIEPPAAPAARPQAGRESPSTQRALVVQPNFEVVVYPEVAGIALLVELDRFAERVSMDRAALYRLTRAGLCRGLQEGLTLAGIMRTLERHNAGPLPQNVAYSLAEWERLFSRIHVHRAVSLIEADDDAELAALRALPQLADAREIAPRLLLVPPGATVIALPQKPEILDYTAPITHALEFETPTRLRVLQPSPRLLHRLHQIAEPIDGVHHGAGEPRLGREADSGGGRTPGEDTEGARRGATRKGRRTAVSEAEPAGRSSSSDVSPETSVPPPCPPCLRGEPPSVFELSPGKVARAGKWWRWEAIHAFLASAARSQPPVELAVRLRGWAGEMAGAAVAPLLLLAAPSAEWLDQVLLVPEIKPLLLYRLSPTLAMVLEANRPRLEAALAELGIAVGGEVSVSGLITSAERAEAEAGEFLLVGPPRKRRALLEQAIAARRRVMLADVSYTGRLNQTKVDPLRIEGEGAGAALVARMDGYRYEHRYPLNRIQGVRMLDEPVKP